MWQLIKSFLLLLILRYHGEYQKLSVYGCRREFKDFRFWTINNKVISTIWCLGYFWRSSACFLKSCRHALGSLDGWHKSYKSTSWTEEFLMLIPFQVFMYLSENLTAAVGLFPSNTWIYSYILYKCAYNSFSLCHLCTSVYQISWRLFWDDSKKSY